MWRWSYHHDLDRLNGYSDIKKMVTVTSLYVFVGNAKKQKQKKLRGQPLLFPSKKKLKRCFITGMIQGTIWSTTNWFLCDSVLEPSTVAPGRDLLLQRRDVQINIADVNPIVRDWRIHPHVVRAQQLHRIIRHQVSVMSQFYSIVLHNYLIFVHIFSLLTCRFW